MKSLKYLIAAIVFLSITICAQDEDVKKMPGFFDFGELGSLDDGGEGAEVFIEAHLLKMVSKFTSHEDPELAALLNGLKLVRVNTFHVNKKNAQVIKDKLTSIRSALQNKNWDRIVRVKEKDQDMTVYVQTDRSSKINGLVVAGIDNNSEAVFVNIVGEIDLDALGKLSDKFDIPSLDEFKKKK